MTSSLFYLSGAFLESKNIFLRIRYGIVKPLGVWRGGEEELGDGHQRKQSDGSMMQREDPKALITNEETTICYNGGERQEREARKSELTVAKYGEEVPERATRIVEKIKWYDVAEKRGRKRETSGSTFEWRGSGERRVGWGAGVRDCGERGQWK